jgi:hypothetical protein
MIKDNKMKKTFIITFAILAAFTAICCKAGDKINIKTAEKEITADINRILEEEMMDIGLSGVKLKNASKNQNATFAGTVTYLSGDSNMELEIFAKYEPNILTYWFSDDPDNTFSIHLGEPVYQMANENPDFPETSGQTVGSSDVGQASNTQPTETLSKVEQRGSTFTTFDSRGNQITHFSSPNRELVGSGRDFFVIRSGTTFYTYDTRCKQISTITIGGATMAKVEPESFTVKVGSSNFKYNKSCRRI